MPPGGSTCLLRAVIYDENHRELGTYPVSAMRESGGSYVCALSGLDAKYAGRSIRFETRISQSAGQVSSASRARPSSSPASVWTRRQRRSRT